MTNDSSATTEVNAHLVSFWKQKIVFAATGERYDWYEAKSLKTASMAVSSENLKNRVDISTLRQSLYTTFTKWTQNTTLMRKQSLVCLCHQLEHTVGDCLGN